MIYDLIIIGMGPAGISAAIYAKRSGLNVLVFEKNMPGGLMNITNKIENYPGLSSISGFDLSKKMFEQLISLDIEYKMEEVVSITSKDIKVIKTKKHKYKTKTVLIATGRESRKLKLPNEDKLRGKGISYCALCDAPLFKGKKVAIIGGGNSALTEALYLSKIVKEVIVINRGDFLVADDILEDDIAERKNIKVLLNRKIVSLEEKDGYLSGIKLDNNEILEVEGLFVYIGYEPKTDFVKDLDIINAMNYIKVNDKYETKAKGIYAAGDIIDKDVYQIVTAVSEGAIAATNIYRSLYKG